MPKRGRGPTTRTTALVKTLTYEYECVLTYGEWEETPTPTITQCGWPPPFRKLEARRVKVISTRVGLGRQG